MRAIHISNEKKHDAEVAFDIRTKEKSVHMVLPNGEEKQNVKILKVTVELDEQELMRKYGDRVSVANALIEEDPEVDMEIIGKKLQHTHKLYVDADNKIVYRINLYQIIRNPDGTERMRRDINKLPGNVNIEIPLKWTGKKISKEEVIRRFVFTRKYQIRHINGATFEFLYNMAKVLHDSQSMVMIGAGPKGKDPLLLSRGGEAYRAFMEGRIDGERYCLILHLTDIELKTLENETVSQ